MNQKQDLQSSPNSSIEKILALFKSIQKNYRDMIFEKSRQYGLTGPQMGVIFSLHHKPFITLHELSEQMGLSKSTTSGIIDRLVSQGIVIREIPEDNRRIVRLSLSQDFLRNNDLIDLKNKYLTDILSNATPEDLQIIISGLERLCELVKESRQ